MTGLLVVISFITFVKGPVQGIIFKIIKLNSRSLDYPYKCLKDFFHF